MKMDLPWVQAIKRRNGSLRYFFRRVGYPRVRLPGEPGSPEFMEAYNAAKRQKEGVQPPRTGTRGTIAVLIDDYRNSAEFSQLADLTRREMNYELTKWREANGDWPVKVLRPADVYRWRDHRKDRPGAANKLIRTVKVVMGFAIMRGYRDTNPATGVKMMKLKEFRAWTAEEMAAFESRWSIGSLERLGYALALYTGQRRADLVALTYSCFRADALHLKQRKTGAVLAIPIHPELRKALPAIYPNDDTPILAKRARKPLGPIYFGHLMAKAIGDAGLPDECVLHGLRKSAAVALIEAGCTPHEAAAITGHKSARMLEEYIKQRDQAKLGRDAMKKWIGK